MTEAGIISPASTWTEAMDRLIEFWADKTRCYSSGEIATVLRTHRTDLKFSVPRLGDRLRDMFYAGDLPRYAADFPVQYPRYTSGSGRTPAGVEVFVYGPSVDDCEVHDFEVDIPQPGVLPQDMVGPTVPASQVTAPAPAPVSTTRNLPPAYVGNDGRCYIPRKVVDAYLHEGGITLQQGDQLYIQPLKDGVLITADPSPAAKACNIWKGSGRVAFYGTPPFTKGQSFKVVVSPLGITVNW